MSSRMLCLTCSGLKTPTDVTEVATSRLSGTDSDTFPFQAQQANLELTFLFGAAAGLYLSDQANIFAVENAPQKL